MTFPVYCSVFRESEEKMPPKDKESHVARPLSKSSASPNDSVALFLR